MPGDGLILKQLIEQSYSNSAAHGFWDNERTDETIPNKLMLIVSEIGEALESYRDPQSDNLVKVPADIVEGILSESGQAYDASMDVLSVLYDKWQAKPRGFDVEIADAFIRLADLCGALGIDIEETIRRKHEYNVGRERMHGRKV